MNAATFHSHADVAEAMEATALRASLAVRASSGWVAAGCMTRTARRLKAAAVKRNAGGENWARP